MSPEQFVYWLQGFAEVGIQPPNEEQWQIIKDHLSLVFMKVTPTPLKKDASKRLCDPLTKDTPTPVTFPTNWPPIETPFPKWNPNTIGDFPAPPPAYCSSGLSPITTMNVNTSGMMDVSGEIVLP